MASTLSLVAQGNPGALADRESIMGVLTGKETKCMRLYEAGLSDGEIGRRMFVSHTTIKGWRRRAGLSRNSIKGGRISDAENHVRRSLYEAGMNDTDIARNTDRSPCAITNWRKSRGLPGVSTKRLSKAQNAQRLALYHVGMSDREIGEELGFSISSISEWRERHGLSTHNPAKRNLSPEQHAARRMLYDIGWNDCAIAREQRTVPKAIQLWRSRQGLPARKRTYKPRRAGDPILERIRLAVGRALPPDLADDAVSDLYLAALEGKVSLEKIETEARSFSKRVQSNFANKFRSRSVDEALAGTDDLLMIDSLVDESAEDWLEEMGASISHIE